MAKNNNEAPKTKRGPDITMQKVKKAKNCLKSAGRRGLDSFLNRNPDIKGHREVTNLLSRAAKMPTKAPKGKRGPTPRAKMVEVEVEPQTV